MSGSSFSIDGKVKLPKYLQNDVILLWDVPTRAQDLKCAQCRPYIYIYIYQCLKYTAQDRTVNSHNIFQINSPKYILNHNL